MTSWPGCVESITARSSSGTNRRLTGDVAMEPGVAAGIRLISDTIYIDFDTTRNGALNGDDCPCDDVEVIPITQIGGVSPLPDGSFPLVGTDCLEVAAGTAGGLELSNPCSEPCYDCSDLAGMRADLDAVTARQAALIELSEDLETQIQAYERIIAAGY